MGPIWVKIYEQYKALKQAGVPSYECERRAVPHMTRAEAIAALHEAIEAIRGFTASIKAIPGSNRDPDIQSQIRVNSKYVTRYMNEIDLYNRLTEDRFGATFPTTTFAGMGTALHNLEAAAHHFVQRGMRYNPR